MHVKPTIIVALAAVALGVVAPAVAAPTTPPIDPKKVCPLPGPELCASTPTDSVCGKLHLEHCKALLGDTWKNNPARAGAEVRPMLRPNVEPDMPQNLRSDGRFYPYKPTKALVRGDVRSLSVMSPLIRAVSLKTAQKAKVGHRNPAWQADGSQVSSCEEWAYESIYDWGRFLDSAALCDGDASCVMDLAVMKATPGIVGRTLNRSDGVPLDPQLTLARTAAPKNVMYSVAADWVYVDGKGKLAQTPELKAMEADLKKGHAYRAFGGCTTVDCKGAAEVYASEWDWHLKMREKLAKYSFEEREEFARRRAEFERLYAAWARAAGEELRKLAAATNQTPRKKPWLDPGERMPWEVLLDPLERIGAVQRFERATAAASPSRGRVNPPVLRAIPSPAPDWGLGFVAPAPTLPLPKKDPLGKEPLVLECGNAVGPAHLKMGVLSCKLASFMREEWRRKQRGQLSCLDPANDACDWSPEMFRDRVMALGEVYLNQQQERQDFCKRVLHGGPLTKQAVGAVQASLDALVGEVEKARKALKSYTLPKLPDSKGLRFGADSGDADTWGDKSLFAAGYNYHFGWRVEPNEVSAVDKRPCSLEGDTHNSVGLEAHVFKRRLELASAALDASANVDRSKKITLSASTRVLGVDLFPAVKEDNITQLFETESPPLTKDTPRASYTFMAGPVPIALAGWGQMSLGYRVDTRGDYGACDPDKPRFALVSTFSPEAAADAVAQVGVGISGVASVGVRGALNLIRLGFPLTARFEVAMEKMNQLVTPTLKFDAGLAMTLATLAGRAALYIEFLLFEDEWEIFSWPGVGPHRIELMTLFDVKLPLTGMMGDAK